MKVLLERTLRSLGSKSNWSKLAAEMDVPLRTRSGRNSFKNNSRTVRDYVEFLAASYALLIVYFWKPGADSSSISKDKKVYLGDPLLHTVASDYAPGLVPDRAASVENAIALALYRKYEPPERQIEAFGAPQDLHVWESERGNEVDFVCGPRSAINAVEVKYSDSVDARIAAGMKRAFPGRPVLVASKNHLAFGSGHIVIPAHMLLWLLG